MLRFNINIIYICFILSLVLGNSINNLFLYISPIFAAVILLTCDTERGFYFSIFLIPNIRILDGLGVSFIVNLILAIPLIKYCLDKKGLLNVFALFSAICLFFIEFLHIAVLGNYSNLPSTLSNLLGMFFCMSISLDTSVNLELETTWFYLSGGVIFSALAYMISHISYLQNIVQQVVNNNRFEGYASDPNYYSLYISLSIAILFVFNRFKFKHYLILFALIIIGLLTASKMFLLLIIFILFTGLSYNILISNNRKRRRIFFITVTLIIVGIIIFNGYLLMFYDNFIRRAGLLNAELNIDQLTSDRTMILREYIAILLNNPMAILFGYGFQYHLYITDSFMLGAHNTYFDIILAWGVIGGCLTLGIYYFWFIKFRRKWKLSKLFINYLPFYVLLIALFGLSCLSATMFWWMVTCSMLPMKKLLMEAK